MKLKRITTALVTLCLAACLLALAACSTSTDAEDIKGEWKVKGTEVTFVFTGTQLRSVAGDIDYTLDTDAKTINYKIDGTDYSSAAYTLSEDKQTLTLEENYEDGGSKTTTFKKISDNVDAEPSAG